MSRFTNLSLAKKLYGLAGVLLAFVVLMAAVSLSGVSSGSRHSLTILLLALVLLLGGALTVFTVRQLTGSVQAIIERLASVEKAAK